MPDERAKNPGTSSCPIAMTGTPRVSRYSSVAGTSRIAFGPAQTTAIAVRPSSSRSDEMSSDAGAPVADASSAPRWTPPMPPVANTRIPAAAAAIIVADTVVAAQPPSASATARLGRAALRTDPAGAVASASSAAASNPTSSRPSRTATVAGTASGVSRTAASEADATSRFCGYGSPWLISVDSSATTGRPSASAAATSGATTRRSATEGDGSGTSEA